MARPLGHLVSLLCLCSASLQHVPSARRVRVHVRHASTSSLTRVHHTIEPRPPPPRACFYLSTSLSLREGPMMSCFLGDVSWSPRAHDSSSFLSIQIQLMRIHHPRALPRALPCRRVISFSQKSWRRWGGASSRCKRKVTFREIYGMRLKCDKAKIRSHAYVSTPRCTREAKSLGG